MPNILKRTFAGVAGIAAVGSLVLTGQFAVAAQPAVAADSSASAKCPSATVQVSNSSQLQSALNNASAGTVIRLADGLYKGEFGMSNKNGTKDRPIWVCGSRDAKIDNGQRWTDGAGLRVKNVSNVNFQGFTIRNARQGLMLFGGKNVTIDSLRVGLIGIEGIHVYGFSKNVTVSNNEVFNTGLEKPAWGEGIYVGTSPANWDKYTDKKPDTTSNVRIVDNKISNFTAEGIEAKAGSSNGVIEGNVIFRQLAASNTQGALTVTGDSYQVRNNTIDDFYQSAIRLQACKDWGKNNVFENNTGRSLTKNGYGVSVHTPGGKVQPGNVISCNNKFENVIDQVSLVSDDGKRQVGRGACL